MKANIIYARDDEISSVFPPFCRFFFIFLFYNLINELFHFYIFFILH